MRRSALQFDKSEWTKERINTREIDNEKKKQPTKERTKERINKTRMWDKNIQTHAHTFVQWFTYNQRWEKNGWTWLVSMTTNPRTLAVMLHYSIEWQRTMRNGKKFDGVKKPDTAIQLFTKIGNGKNFVSFIMNR